MNFMLEQYIDSSLCDEIIKDFNTQIPKPTNSTRGYWLVSSDNICSDLLLKYKTEISKVITLYKNTFREVFEGFESMILEEPFNFQKYDPGHHYSVWHCENNGKPSFEKRVLAFTTYLNTVENGGETDFPYQYMKVTPKKGKTLVWPAYFTHTHRGLPAPDETKYIVTGWVKFDPWKDVDLEMSDEDFFSNLNQDTKVTW